MRDDVDLTIRILVALGLGLALGVEREYHGHPAGLRTMALVAVGSCMFTALGFEPVFGRIIDPTRIAAQVVTGVGFLGAGSILRQGEYVRGLTTAASIWVVASIGMAAGFGYYFVAALTTFVVILTLVGIRPIENRFFRNARNRRHTDPHPDEAPGQ